MPTATGVAQVDKAGLHIGAIAFIHRFGSRLNQHAHFHFLVIDGVFEDVEGYHWITRKRAVMTVRYRRFAGLGFAPYQTVADTS